MTNTTEIKVMTSNALRAVLGELAPAFERAHGHKISASYDPDFKHLTLTEVQRGKPDLDRDRHGIVVDPVRRKLYEFYRLTRTDKGWQAEQASVFDLTSNKLRPDGWTSSDAAGLPIFPSVVSRK